ncbi:TlpA disulfide reductase family protein [Verrucosispora sp. WMMA2044]|uniref:TlpA family protein disulfide reductase n=1 Tax=Verrucosispora sioxanthis TaxID=2499994 RepID=A0A6M1L929_9ACTN|nr:MULTISPECIES: TlpA disulfide reductase family protein [Micromonospora]NEE65668.1 TlpA family protein disulfide reductase [Verrucosispora sioxanthis]NGM14778.1 TlpA family protein disulfide reductase [Verrucosispora sioxanthis]WBB48726.1 TlpA disulfide reductase family protein [Verrucosispora sp. WMMA2044]
MNRRLALLTLPLLLVLATACTTDPEAPRPAGQGTVAARPSPFEGCADLTEGPAGPGDDEATGDPLPELTLTCFTGGTPVALRNIRGPAVVNIWASWCPPCRKELPAFQRLHERADGQLRVIGVNSRDSREGAQSIGEDFGVRFPMLVDQGEAVQRALRRNAVPLTVFVDARGGVRHIDSSGALDDARLAELVGQHLGLTVRA